MTVAMRAARVPCETIRASEVGVCFLDSDGVVVPPKLNSGTVGKGSERQRVPEVSLDVVPPAVGNLESIFSVSSLTVCAKLVPLRLSGLLPAE